VEKNLGGGEYSRDIGGCNAPLICSAWRRWKDLLQ